MHGFNVLGREGGAAKALELLLFVSMFKYILKKHSTLLWNSTSLFVLISVENPIRKAFESLQNPLWSPFPLFVLVSVQNVIRKAFESSQNPLWSFPLPDW